MQGEVEASRKILGIQAGGALKVDDGGVRLALLEQFDTKIISLHCFLGTQPKPEPKRAAER
jgi:hypothetical protein